MANTYTANARMAKPALNDPDWHIALNANADILDGMTAIGGLTVRPKESPSGSLDVRISAGTFAKSDRSIGTYAGSGGVAMTASTTNYLYLDDSGSLTVNTTGWPDTAHLRLASVIAGASTITSVADARIQCIIAGSGIFGGGGSGSGALSIASFDSPSTNLNIKVASGSYLKANGTIGTYAGVASQAVPASSTTLFWLTDAGVLTTGASYPTTAHIRIGTVVSGTSIITSVTDDRIANQSISTTGGGYVQKAGDTVSGTFVVATPGTGTSLMTLNGASRLVGFFDKSPASQATAINTLTLTVGTATDNLSDVGGAYNQTTLNNNFRSLTEKVNGLINAIKRHGLMGS